MSEGPHPSGRERLGRNLTINRPRAVTDRWEGTHNPGLLPKSEGLDATSAPPGFKTCTCEMTPQNT